MSRHFIERRYGHGAGRVPLRPVGSRPRIETRSLAEGLRAAAADGESPGPVIRQELMRLGPALLGLTLVLTFGMAALLRLPADETELRIVPFEEPPLQVVVEEPLPEPEPEIEPEPEPEPEVAKVEPPPPPPERIVQAPKPPPPPEPVRERIRPVEPPPGAPPRIALAEPPPDVPTPPPLAPTRAPAPAFAAARPPDVRPRLDAPRPRRTPNPTPELLRERPRVAPTTPQARPAPDLALAAPAPNAPRPRPTPQREARRPTALPTPPRRKSKTEVALPTSRPQPQRPSPKPTLARKPRVAPTAAPASPDRTGSLPGVALGSLDACVSDRMEDALKQRVVAQVRDRTQCESQAGRYHFVETKNVNAFLMRIERGKERRRGDRCAELTYALDCLKRSSGRGGR
jgi:hypothetical protein